MNLNDLDWPRFLALAADYARTPYGKLRIIELESINQFAQSIESAQRRQTETQEIRSIVDKEALWGPLRDLDEIDEELQNLEKSGVLDLASFLRVRGWLYCFDAWTHFPKELAGNHFKQALLGLFDPMECIRAMDQIITPRGEISERASPKLHSLNSQMRDLKAQIESQMSQVMREYFEKGVLQENYSDIRDGRYVLPVKVSDQSKVDGRVAELSVSRQTVFIEPKEVEQLQSRLRRVEADASEELFRILLALSTRIRPFVDSIGASVEIVAYWDAVRARAKIAEKYTGRAIEVSAERAWVLENTVNPMLFWSMDESEIIRNSIELQSHEQMILLSGPNTGGKTVLLKTLGMSAVMARTGFFYPGTGKLQVPYFESFFIDLGDPQSIEQHLSSFSGHVLKMKNILEGLGESSLVLIDEMNSATDPEEGAALAQAFVQKVLEAPGAVLIATTHDPRLKAMGVNDERVLNASIIFNEESLKPTYRVVFGAPGRSRALETAERLGMPADVLAVAKGFLSQEHRGFESVLQQLQTQLSELEKAKNEARTAQELAEKLKQQWEEKVQSTVNEQLEKARQKLKHVLDLAQMEVREAVKKVQSAKSHKQVDEIRSELNRSFEQGQSRLETAVPESVPEFAEILDQSPETQKQIELKVGIWVRVPRWKNVGQVTEWDGKKARVALGAQQSTGLGKAFVVSVFPVEVEPLSDRELQSVLGLKATQKKKSTVKIQTEDVGVVPAQIDLRGKRLDEAMSEVEVYLDRAFRSGSAEVTIVHGLGTGAIREAVRVLLNRTNYVTEFGDAGTPGATRVQFSR